MKFLKVFIICFSLFQLQIFQGKQVFAQDPTPTPAATPAAQANTGNGVINGAYMAPNLSAGTTVEENETKNPSLAGGHIFTAIQMIVIGLLAPTIIRLCPNKASTYVYGAGALYYVAMELINMGKFVKGSNEEMSIFKNVDVDIQMAALEAAATETEKAAEAAHKKADLSINAAIVFAIAAIAALAEAIIGNSPGPQAASPMFSKLCTGAGMTPPPVVNSDSKTNKTYIAFQNHQMNALKDLDQKEKSLLSKVLDLVMPQAEAADTGVLSGLVGGVAAAIVAVTVAKEAMAKLLRGSFGTSGVWRFGFYGVFAGIGYGASSSIRDAAEDLDERAEQYRNLAAKLLQNSKGGIQMGGSAQLINQGFAGSSLDEVSIASEQMSCFTGGQGQLVRDQNCLCKKANNCKKAEVPKLNFQGFGGNGILNDNLALFNDSANSLFGGDLAGAQASGAGLSNSAGKLGKLRRKVIEKFNSDRKSRGEDAKNFDAAAEKIKSSFAKVVKSGLNGLSPSQASALASMAPSESSRAGKTKQQNANKGIKGTKISGTRSNKSSKEASFGFSLDDDQQGEISEGGINPDDLANSMSGDNMFQGDISARPEENIFKIITTRYLKSAYPNFFSENENPNDVLE